VHALGLDHYIDGVVHAGMVTRSGVGVQPAVGCLQLPGIVATGAGEKALFAQFDEARARRHPLKREAAAGRRRLTPRAPDT
jgi:hypothetical protein